jgi:D-alanyl-D-alanine carboxypeptidase
VTPDPVIDRSSRRNRARTRRRQRVRRERALAALAGAVLLIVVGLGLHALAPAGPSAAAHRPAPAARGARAARSPLGLPLGTPPLRLGDAGGPAVRPAIGDPPRAGVLVDLDTGHVLWSRNAATRLPIASLTKMMTALLAVEHTTPDATAPVTREAIAQQGSKVGMLPLGRHVPVRALLAGLLLPSGNDAAVALAQDVGGSVRRFVALMNERAAALGMGCTRYAFPSGFVDAGNYSCADDLAELADVDIRQPRIESLSRLAGAMVPFPIRGGRLFLNNNNPLVLAHYPGISGLKTGYTAAAGMCLVATARRGGTRLAVVLLHSPNIAAQGRALLDAGFAALAAGHPST